jgi:hypothetical protein
MAQGSHGGGGDIKKEIIKISQEKSGIAAFTML